jgi:hypothetical protein
MSAARPLAPFTAPSIGLARLAGRLDANSGGAGLRFRQKKAGLPQRL